MPHEKGGPDASNAEAANSNSLTVESNGRSNGALAAKYFGTYPKMRRGRGKAQKSLDLIEAMYEIAERLHPITVRGIAYKLFARELIASMKTKDTKRVSSLLVDAREDGAIPWEWIVDETRMIEEVASWYHATEYVSAVRRSYRRDFWAYQPQRVNVWSEKGTVRGVVGPVLDEYGVGFLPVHGFNSATKIMEIVQACSRDDRR